MNTPACGAVFRNYPATCGYTLFEGNQDIAAYQHTPMAPTLSIVQKNMPTTLQNTDWSQKAHLLPTYQNLHKTPSSVRLCGD